VATSQYIPELARGLNVQARVIWALLMRDMRTRYGQYNLGYLWAIFLPLSFIITITIIFSFIGRRNAHGVPMEIQMLSGAVLYFGFLSTKTQIMSAYNSNKAIFVYPMIHIIDIIISKSIIEYATYVMVLIILLSMFWVMGVPESYVDDPLKFAFYGLLSILMGISFGHIMSCIMLWFPSAAFLNTVITRVMFFTSGVWFLLSDIPNEWRTYILYNPMAHIIDQGRGAFISAYTAPDSSLSYIIEWLIGLTVIAIILDLFSRRKRRGGSG
jgi:capsular polysaccharide transport system permease protein